MEPTSTQLNPITDVDLFNRAEEKIPSVWDKLIYKGRLHLFSAYMKTGKTEFLTGLCKEVLSGGDFLGFETNQSKILYLSEEHTNDIRKRLERVSHTPTGCLFIHGRDSGFLTLDGATIEDIKLFIITNGVEVLIIDTISKFWTVENENDAGQVTAAIKPLLDLAGSTGAAVILVHHDRKSEGEHGRQIRGSGALFALVDQALLLSRPQGGNKTQRLLKTLGRFSESPEELLIDFVDGRYVSLGSPEIAAHVDATDNIWAVLSDGSMTIREIVEVTKLKDKKVRQVLDTLSDNGLTKKVPTGKQGGGFAYEIIEAI